MTYVGTKFKTEKIGEDLPNSPRLDRLKYWCKAFHEKGLAPPYDRGSFGNLSFRLKDSEDAFVITASRSSLEDSVTDDRFVTVPRIDLEKGIVYAIGSREPSSESMIHYALYLTRPYVQAIFHGHCGKITQDAERLSIPLTLKEEPYGTRMLVERVLQVLKGHYFMEMRNHGFISLGESIDDAGNLALKFLKKC